MANKFLTSGEQSDIFDDPALTRQKLGIIYGPGGTTQSYDNTLNSLANLSTTAGKIIKCDGSDSFTTIPITTEGESLINGTASIPSNTSDLTNDSGFITSSSIPTSLSSFTNDTNFITSSSIPTTLSTFTNDTNYITSSGVPTALSSFTNDTNFITSSGVPTALSSFTNDTNFITLSTAGTMTNKSIEVDVDSSKTLSFMKSGGLAPVKTILVSQNHNNTSTGNKTIFLPAINFGLSNDILVGQTTTATLTNKTIDYNNNTITNLPSSGIQSGDNISLLTNNSGYITSSSLSGYMPLDGNSTITGTQTFTDVNFTQYGNVLSADGIAKLILGDSNTYISNEKNANLLRINTNRLYVSFNKPLFLTERIFSSVDGIWSRNSSNGNYYVGAGNTSGVDGVGIGTDSPNDTLDVNGTIRITGGSPDYLRIRLSNTFSVGEATNDSVPGVVGNNFPNGSAIIEYTGGQSTINNEGAYIWLNGDTIGIMNTGDTNTFHWYDSDTFPSANSGQHWYISTSGSITNSSDLTLKNNIRYFDDEYDISNSKHKYSQIKFCKYNWKKELKDPSGVKEDFYGIIAQEIEPLFPEMIETDEGGLKMIKQERLQYISYYMIANLIQENDILKAEFTSLKQNTKATQELDKIIREQQVTIKTLEDRIGDLEAIVGQLIDK